MADRTPLGEVTDRRLKMLANGYAPLPVVGKRPPLNGWPTIAIDETSIRSWENPSLWRHVATGTPMSTGARTGDTVGSTSIFATPRWRTRSRTSCARSTATAPGA
jgi:hypothetical protein